MGLFIQGLNMKQVRNFIFASYLNFRVSTAINPVLTALLTTMSVVFLYSVLKIFGL